MKICLLTCAAPFLIDQKVFPPLGLLAVGTALRAQGHEVTIEDTPDNSNHFGLGPTTPEYPSALRMLNQIKLRDQHSQVIIGGPHATANPQECLADGFDAVVTGDGENITSDTFKFQGVANLERNSLDQYPTLDRSLLDIHSYRYSISNKAATTMLTSRGCPYCCGFCVKTNKRVRFRSVSSVEREVDYLQNRWGFKALMLFDDTFILDESRAKQICKVLQYYGMTWRCFVRGDLVVRHGQDFVDLMFDCGCVEVGIGIESGSDRILQTVHKGESVNTIRQAIFMLHQAHIRVKGFFIIGLPGEDPSSLAETRWFIGDVGLDDADFTIYQPYRNSPIWDNKSNYDIFWGELPTEQTFYKGRSGEYQSTVYTSSLTSKDITQARDELEEQFQCR